MKIFSSSKISFCIPQKKKYDRMEQFLLKLIMFSLRDNKEIGKVSYLFFVFLIS